jgi:WD40 repeat protein
VKIYDLRMEQPVSCLVENTHWIVLADFVKGDRELLTGSLTGDIRFWDLRRTGQPLRYGGLGTRGGGGEDDGGGWRW